MILASATLSDHPRVAYFEPDGGHRPGPVAVASMISPLRARYPDAAEARVAMPMCLGCQM